MTSLKEIAEQKAGIFKAGKKAVIKQAAPEAKLVCQNTARELGLLNFFIKRRDFTLNAGILAS